MTPIPCATSGLMLPVPAATFPVSPTAGPTDDFYTMQRLLNRQARLINANDYMAIELDSGHPSYGLTRDISATLYYLDAGTGVFTISFPLSDSTSTSHAITRTNTGFWQKTTWGVEDVVLANYINTGRGPAFARIETGATAQYLHMLEDQIAADAGPTSTPTFTSTPTATATSTATSTVTPTPPAGLVINEVCPAPDDDWNLDGSGPNPRDRAVELYYYDAGGAQKAIAGFALDWNSAYTYTIPSGVYLNNAGHKVIFGDAISTFWMPVTGTVRLYDLASTQLDVVTYTAQASGFCYQRYPSGSANWVSDETTLGY